MNRIFAAIVLGITMLDALIGLLSIHAAQRIYPFSAPFAVAIVVCVLAGMIATGTNSRLACLVQNASVAVSFVLFVLAVMNWSGGDDGPGMLMVGGVGPTLLPAAILAVISTILIARNLVDALTSPPHKDIPTPSPIPGLAIASLVTSCLSLFIGPPGCIAGVICGHLARRQMRQQPRLGGANVALAGLIVGYVFLVVYAIVFAWLIWCAFYNS
jgi:hypothetical protein